MRKLALVNSVADASTMRVISNTQSSTLRSLGLINCFYLGDTALETIIENVRIRTLNIRLVNFLNFTTDVEEYLMCLRHVVLL